MVDPVAPKKFNLVAEKIMNFTDISESIRSIEIKIVLANKPNHSDFAISASELDQRLSEKDQLSAEIVEILNTLAAAKSVNAGSTLELVATVVFGITLLYAMLRLMFFYD